MTESTFPIVFIGGSKDGEVMQATEVPDYFGVPVVDDVREIYQRQTEEAPFAYVQIGYAGNEIWK
jgi:hypothetical protein